MKQRGTRTSLVGILLVVPVVLAGSRVAGQDVVNLARQGTASQSTTNGSYVAGLAIDGNYTNFTHTLASDTNATWRVDLRVTCPIQKVVLYNRTSCCQSRLRDITVSVLDASGTVAAFTSELLNPGNVLAGPASIAVDLVALTGGPVTGQIVRVVRTPDPAGTTDEYRVLALAEVEVLVDPATIPTTIQTHPVGARKYVGACHVFSVGLAYPQNSSSISYQWYKDDAELAGETGPRLIVGDIQPDDAGSYKVVVTADSSVLTSNSAALVVPGLNLALTGTATQSTTAYGGVPERANDGNTSGAWASNSLSHTDNFAGSWWQVQLYGESTVEKVVLWNRTDCCAERLSNFRVSALAADGSEVWGGDYFTDVNTWPVTTTSGFEIVPPAPIDCRTIKVQRLGPDKGGNNFMSLAEAEVFGSGLLPPPPALPNIARACGTVASQSTTNGSFVAGLALDGNLGNFTHTVGTDSNAWWQVDLGRTFDVAIVVVHNRTSCCGSRLRDITVSVLDAAGTLQWASPLLNPENELGAYPNGPARLWVDLRILAGGPVAGQIVRVQRTADPDFSGGGDGTNPDEGNVLSLGEVEIYEPPSWCPAGSGDTHCGGLTVAGPGGGLPGVYVATAEATDDSGDEIQYTFTAEKAGGPTLVIGPQAAAAAALELDAGSWTVSVSVDDDPLCLDVAGDASCSQAVEVAVHGENLAVGGAATQSSEYQGGMFPAALGIDGNLGNFTHTDPADAAPWWQVSLARDAKLYAVLVHNRDDCCGSRLRDITVSVLDAAGDLVWSSPLLNPENALGAYPLGPAVLTVDLADGGAPTGGSTVRVSRTPDPDFSGSGGQGNDGEPASLILGEVQVFGDLCPAEGDTHCTEFALSGPAGNEPGTYTVAAAAADDSGDPISYTFRAIDGAGTTLVVGPQAQGTAAFDLTVGVWTISATADDDLLCSDAAADSTRATQVVVGGNWQLAGDCDQNGQVDISDVVCDVAFLYTGFNLLDRTLPTPPCATAQGNLAVADVNGDGGLNVSDIVYLASYLFLGGPPPTRGTACYSVPADALCPDNVACQ